MAELLGVEGGARPAQGGARPGGERQAEGGAGEAARRHWRCARGASPGARRPDGREEDLRARSPATTPSRRAARPPAAGAPQAAPRPESAEAAAPREPAPKIALTIVKPEEPKKAKVVLPQTSDANYEFPPLKLLKEQAKRSGRQQRRGAPAQRGEPAADPRRVRRRGLARRDPRGPGDHPLRGRARARRARREDRRPGEEHRPRHARAVRAHPRAHPGQGRRRASRCRTCTRRRSGMRELLESEDWVVREGGASHRARARRLGQAARLGPGQDAPPDDRRRDGLGQVGLHQLDRHLDPVLEEPEGRAPDHGRPEGRRAEDLQQPSAHVHPGRHRAQEGAGRAQVAAGRDGAALPDLREGERQEHRRVQQRARRTPRPQAEAQASLQRLDPLGRRHSRSRSTCPTSSRSSTSSPT